MSQSKQASILDSRILVPAIAYAFKKLNPRTLARNPVMFVVATVSVLTTVLFIRDLIIGNANLGFSFQINLWLWFTVLFANFAEAVAEGRGKAQAMAERCRAINPAMQVDEIASFLTPSNLEEILGRG
ncbi:MAG: hypothetical protein ACK4OI_00805, partial [Rhizobium oryzihabitans]